MAQPVVIEFVGRDGVTRVARVVSGSLDDVADAANRTSSGARDAGDSMRDAGQKGQQASKGLSSFESGLEKIASATVAVEAAKKVYDFTSEGAAIAGVRDAYTNLAESANVDSKKLLTSLQTASKGYVDDVTLMRGANKALLSGNQELANELPKLLEIAGAASKATGQDMGQMYSDLLEGITKAEPEILDNLGLTINLTQVYDDYAKSLGKTANDLTQSEKSQALLNEVLQDGDAYVQRLGGSAVETGGALKRLTTEWDNWMAARKEEAALGLEDLLNGGQTVAKETQFQALEGNKSYDQYLLALQRLGEEEEAVTRAQYEFAQSLTQSGVATTDAMQRGKSYSFELKHLKEMLTDSQGGMELTAESLTAIESAWIRASEGGSVFQESLDQIGVALAEGDLTIYEYYTRLVELADQADHTTAVNNAVEQSALQVDGAFKLLEQSAAANADAQAWMSDKTAAAALENINKQITAENAANADYLLANAAEQVANGSLTAQDAAVSLAAILGMEEAQVKKLIEAYLALNKAKSNPMVTALKIGGALVDQGGVAAVRKVDELERAARRPARRAGGGRSGGAGGGKSDAVKAAEKEQRDLDQVHKKIEKAESDFRKRVEDTQKKYLERVTAAWRKYYDDLDARTKEFQSDQFDDKADFYTQLASMEQQDRAAAMAAFQQYWAESNALAQAGEVDKANKLREAAQEEILANQQRESKIRELKNQIRDEANADLRADLEEQQRLLEEADRIADDQAQSRLNKIRTDKDELARERDEELADAKTDYDDASKELIDTFKERNAEIATAYGELAVNHASTMDAIMGQAAAATAILASLSGSVAQAQAADQGIPTVAPESRAMGGVMHRAEPYLVGDAPGGKPTKYSEIIVPHATSYAMARNTLDQYLAPSAIQRGGGGGGGNTIFDAGGISVHVNGGNTNIRLTPAEERYIIGIAERVVNARIAQSGNISKLGGR